MSYTQDDNSGLDADSLMLGHYLLMRDRTTSKYGRIVHKVSTYVDGATVELAILAVPKDLNKSNWVFSPDISYAVYPWQLFSDRKDVWHRTMYVSGDRLMDTLYELEQEYIEKHS